MINSKFPGILEKCKVYLKNAIKFRIIDKFTDFFNKSQKLKIIISTSMSIFKMEMKLIDVFKDLGLSFWLLKLIGGPKGIMDLSTNYKSVIVLVMFSSIFIPMIFSSLHLAVNNPTMIFGLSSTNKAPTRLGRYLSIPFCLLFSVSNEIFLTCLYQESTEKAKILSKTFDSSILKTVAWCREIKYQLITFAQLDLGLYNFSKIISV